MRSLSELRRWLCARALARHAGGRGSKPGGGVEFQNNLCKCACAVWVVTILVWVLILARGARSRRSRLHAMARPVAIGEFHRSLAKRKF